MTKKQPDSALCGTIKINERPVAALIPFARNSRTHSEAQVAQIAASIREFGFTNPILIDEQDGIIAGHGRIEAARKLGLTVVPCIVLSGLTEAQKRAYVIADNKLALNAGWDTDLLVSELQGLGDEGFDLSLLGFNEDELAALLVDKTEGLTDPDDIPEVPADPVSVLGDVWILGKHRIVCGDSTDADTVAKCLNGVEPHLMVTDPPYGVEYDPAWRNRAGTNSNEAKQGKVLNDDKADWREAWELFPGSPALRRWTSTFDARSYGQRIGSRFHVVTIIGSMSRAGMLLSATQRDSGRATASKAPCGTSRLAMMEATATAPKSRSSA